jgi:hypothetical protein
MTLLRSRTGQEGLVWCDVGAFHTIHTMGRLLSCPRQKVLWCGRQLAPPRASSALVTASLVRHKQRAKYATEVLNAVAQQLL